MLDRQLDKLYILWFHHRYICFVNVITAFDYFTTYNVNEPEPNNW